MLTTSCPQPHRECSSSDTMCIDELGGWASVAEALLMDCARATLLDVVEPTARQAIAAEYTEALAQLVQRHLAVAAATHRREVVEEEKHSDELARELHAAVQACNSMGEQLVAERTSRVALEEELQGINAELQTVLEEREALQAERAAVWTLMRGVFMSSAHRRNVVNPANTTLEDHVRYLCDWVKDAEAELTAATTAAAAAASTAASPSLTQPVDEAPTSVLYPPRASYRRILPSAPLNPVTASLLRVKEQVQQLREPSVTQLQQAVGAYRPLREENMVTTPPAHTHHAVAPATTAAPAPSAVSATPLSVERSLRLSRSYTPFRSTTTPVTGNGTADNGSSRGNVESGGVPSSPPWRTHMAKLQEELKGLRRDLHSTTPHR
jgi:hypothetical protein